MPTLAQKIDNYFKTKGSPLAGYGATFVQIGQRYGVDPRVLVAISGAETSFGKAGEGLKNIIAYGGGGHQQYPSVGATLTRAAKGLTDPNFVYAGQGNDTIAEIASKWAPVGASNDPTSLNGGWPGAVTQFYRELGGNPSQPVLGASYRGPAQGGQGGQAAPAVPPVQSVTPQQLPNPLGGLDTNRLFGILKAQGNRVLAGKMPSPNYVREMSKLASQIVPRAQANVPTPTPTPTTTPTPAPRGGSAVGPYRAGGGWGGSEGLIRSIALPAMRGTSLQATGKREQPSPVAGTRSDHYVGNKNAFAYDMSDGSNPTPGMDTVASRIVASLGGPRNWGKTGGNFKKVITSSDGRKWAVQVIYRSQVGGNHNNHVHFGAHLVS